MKNKIKLCVTLAALLSVLAFCVSEIRIGGRYTPDDNGKFLTLSYVDGATYRIAVGKNAEYISVAVVKDIANAVRLMIGTPQIVIPEIVVISNEAVCAAIEKLYAVFEETLPEKRTNKIYGNAKET